MSTYVSVPGNRYFCLCNWFACAGTFACASSLPVPLVCLCRCRVCVLCSGTFACASSLPVQATYLFDTFVCAPGPSVAFVFSICSLSRFQCLAQYRNQETRGHRQPWCLWVKVVGPVLSIATSSRCGLTKNSKTATLPARGKPQLTRRRLSKCR